ncbi:biotin transporter BioY [Thioclava sp. FTW29]|uniref:Biotin transporter n=1 Tax=Thioclava litoralis TaxID=3076557 RepID=A0ABZ1E6F9_9RHOB|nr:biotin transporter BioY [Thioclava sp. FTW29]
MERSITLVALFAALTAALGLLPNLTLGFGVPITAQTLGVMLAGTVLGAKRGALSSLLFIMLVALGLPLLSGGRGGLGVFTSPTAGFLIGWPIASFVTGLFVEKTRGLSLTVSGILGSVLGGVVVLYAAGIIGMSIVLDKTILQATWLTTAFIPGDIVKAVLAGFITQGLAKARPQSVLSRAK